MSILSTKFITKNKECAKHILAPSAVACDISQLRASAHPRGAFLISRNELSHVSVTRSFLDIKKAPVSWCFQAMLLKKIILQSEMPDCGRYDNVNF